MNILALVLSYWRETALVAAAALAFASCVARDRAIHARGVALERARVADSTIAAITPRLARVDTLVVRDTVRVRTTIARLDTLRDTVLTHLTDTVVVKAFVHVADSVAASCNDLSRDCAAFRVFAATKIAALESKLAAPIALPRSCVPSNALWGVLGASAGALASRAFSHR